MLKLLHITLNVIHVLNINTDKEGKFYLRTVSGPLNTWSIPKRERIVVEFNSVDQPIGLGALKIMSVPVVLWA